MSSDVDKKTEIDLVVHQVFKYRKKYRKSHPKKKRKSTAKRNQKYRYNDAQILDDGGWSK